MTRRGSSGQTKRRLQVGDAVGFRLVPAMARVDEVVRRLNEEGNVSDFLRKLVLAQIDREQGKEVVPFVNPEAIGHLVTTALRELTTREGAGTLQALLVHPKPGTPPDAAQQEPAVPARGRLQLLRLLGEE